MPNPDAYFARQAAGKARSLFRASVGLLAGAGALAALRSSIALVPFTLGILAGLAAAFEYWVAVRIRDRLARNPESPGTDERQVGDQEVSPDGQLRWIRDSKENVRRAAVRVGEQTVRFELRTDDRCAEERKRYVESLLENPAMMLDAYRSFVELGVSELRGRVPPAEELAEVEAELRGLRINVMAFLDADPRVARVYLSPGDVYTCDFVDGRFQGLSPRNVD